MELNQVPVNGAKRGLSRFDWMHIASHFFSHTQTGRLSGLALWDGDVWLDQLRDLSPLPGSGDSFSVQQPLQFCV